MKKSILTIAVLAASVVAPAAMAAPTVYGNVHLSINAADNDVPGANNNLQMSSNTSAIGVKGSEDLGDGMKAIYKVEFQIDLLGKADTTPDGSAPNQGSGALTGRDQFVGLKGGMGTIKFGTMSSNYKQMGGKVDPLYRTPLEGRGFLNTQSSLHGGRGVNRGRQTNTVQYSSPKMGGFQLVANTTLSGVEDETNGIGIRWANKAFLVYGDWIDGVPTDPVPTSTSTTESALKLGGKFTAKAFSIGLQYETSEDYVSNDYIFASGTFNFNKNNMIALTAGQASNVGTNADTTGLAVAYNHKLSKMTNVYVGYGAKSSDVDAADESMFTAGIKKKF
jgi:predicted porin